MKRSLSWLCALSCAGAMAASGCLDEPRPSASVPLPASAYARISGPDGAELRVEDGVVRAELRIGHADELRTVGLKVRVEGADIVEWARDDALLTSAGGNVLALESRVDDDTLSLVVGTTAPVSVEDDARLATLTLRPVADKVSLSIVADGDHLGLIADGGRRLDVTSLPATLEEARR